MVAYKLGKSLRRPGIKDAHVARGRLHTELSTGFGENSQVSERAATPICPQPHHLRRHWRQRWLPPSDRPDALARLGVVGDALEPPSQFDRSRQLTFAFECLADRGGVGIADEEHRRQHNVRAGGRKLSLCEEDDIREPAAKSSSPERHPGGPAN
jgi:hypothetical protein